MEELIEAFLLLARETDSDFEEQKISVNQLVKEELVKAESLLNGKQTKINIVEMQIWC